MNSSMRRKNSSSRRYATSSSQTEQQVAQYRSPWECMRPVVMMLAPVARYKAVDREIVAHGHDLHLESMMI